MKALVLVRIHCMQTGPPLVCLAIMDSADSSNLDPAPRSAFYPIARSSELKSAPMAVELFGTPLVLYRDATGRAAALLDRCPHRNAPLSMGKVRTGEIECPYHGWRFDGEGRCKAIPGLVSLGKPLRFRVPSYAAAELDGWVYVYGKAGERPNGPPPRFPFADDPRYTRVHAAIVAEGTIRDFAENALDVPHTAFLHRGLFRTQKKTHRVEVVVRRSRHWVEAQYIGEPRPEGLIGRLLAPGGGEVEHYDRFFSPTTAQVEYRLGESSHLVVTTMFTPLGPEKTLFAAEAAVCLPSGIPTRTLAPALKPLAMQILGQDLRMLRIIKEHNRRFDGPRYASTELDVLGAHIEAILRGSENEAEGPYGDEPVEVARVEMEI